MIPQLAPATYPLLDSQMSNVPVHSTTRQVAISGSFGGVEIAREVFMPVRAATWKGSAKYAPMNYCNLKVVRSTGNNEAHPPRLSANETRVMHDWRLPLDEEVVRRRLHLASEEIKGRRGMRDSVQTCIQAVTDDSETSSASHRSSVNGEQSESVASRRASMIDEQPESVAYRPESSTDEQPESVANRRHSVNGEESESVASHFESINDEQLADVTVDQKNGLSTPIRGQVEDNDALQPLREMCPSLSRGCCEYLLDKYDGNLEAAAHGFWTTKETDGDAYFESKYYCRVVLPNGKTNCVLLDGDDTVASVSSKTDYNPSEKDSPTQGDPQLVAFVNGTIVVASRDPTLASVPSFDQDIKNVVRLVYAE